MVIATSIMMFALVMNVQNMSIPKIPTRDVHQVSYRIAAYEELGKVLKEIEITLGYSSQIKILDLQYKGNTLSINLSKEAVQYGGGNAAEQYVGYRLLQWAFEDSSVQEVTLLIEGQEAAFPEGNDFSAFTRAAYEKYLLYP